MRYSLLTDVEVLQLLLDHVVDGALVWERGDRRSWRKLAGSVGHHGIRLHHLVDQLLILKDVCDQELVLSGHCNRLGRLRNYLSKVLRRLGSYGILNVLLNGRHLVVEQLPVQTLQRAEGDRWTTHSIENMIAQAS